MSDALSARFREKALGSSWQRYRDTVVPADADEVQVICTRHAFLGGFDCGLMLARELGHPNLSEDDVAAILDRIDREQRQYIADVMEAMREDLEKTDG
jgi:hypothetical protein